MRVNGEKLKTVAVFPTMMTIADSWVAGANKLGQGHGEAKLYIASKEAMYDFYGNEGFAAKCFILKADLVSYMEAIRKEYMSPSQEYAQKENMGMLWQERMAMIEKQPEVIFFDAYDQKQIAGSRGYVNSQDFGYQLIREIALPLVSYIYVEKLGSEQAPIYYWRLFVDFEAILDVQNGPHVFKYGKRAQQKEAAEEDRQNEARQRASRQRDGQAQYRKNLLEQCPYCPFTMIGDDRLLIASHIKPWAASSDAEKVDPYNGYMLSPLYDRLFDRGYITITEGRRVVLSELLSAHTWSKINLKNNAFIQAIPMDEKRKEYLKYHNKYVFKGSLAEE